jgi:sugar O-acyltransferase (sialic acid O-acetyltransferase NeuD family)
MKKQLIIFGTGDLAQIAAYYFTEEGIYDVVAFTLDATYITTDSFDNKPVIAFDIVQNNFPPDKVDIFIAIGYAKLNEVREAIYNRVKAAGYQLATYISPKCSYMSKELPGDNTFIFEDNTIQPFVKIGSNVVLWSGNHIGHHSIIGDHNFISSHVVVSGRCHIKPNCFLGVNATIGNNVTIANHCIIGAGAVITASTESYGVYVPPKTIKLDKKSNEINL